MGKRKPALYFARRAIRLQKALAKNKELYRALDETIDELVAIGATDVVVGKQRVILHDNFAKGNTSFRAHANRRFDLQIEPVAAKPTKEEK